MDSLRDIEAGLERLMPRGLSDDARLELEAVVDNLSASADPVISIWRKPVLWSSAAAAILALTVGSLLIQKGIEDPVVAAVAQESVERPAGIAVLEQKTWIDSGADLGIQSVNEFGETRRGWTYTGVEEERVLHEDSGYEVILQREFEAELYAASSL